MRTWILLIGLAGCDRTVGIATEPDVDFDVEETGIETDQPGESTIVVSYSFSAWSNPVTCADAHLSTLHITADRQTDAEPLELDWPCDDSDIRLENMRAESWVIAVRGDTVQGPYFAGSVEVETNGQTDTSATVELACEENGSDDGCGMPGQE
jgi:hypothetical protein